MEIAAIISVLAFCASALGVAVYFGKRALDAEDHRRAAEVGQAQLAADLRVSDANVESFRRQVQRYEVIHRSLREVNDETRRHPVLSDPDAHGLDRLLGTLDAVAAIGPPARDAGGAGAAPSVPGGAGATAGAAAVVPRPEPPVPGPRRSKNGT